MKKYFAKALEKSGLNALFGRLHRGETKILLYHSVVKKADFNAGLDYADQCLTDEEFERQMRFLSRRFNVISLDDFFKGHRDKEGINVVITFDDGFLNNYAVAYPILKRYGLKAAFFVTTSFISEGKTPWFIKLAYEAYKSPRFGKSYEEKKAVVEKMKKSLRGLAFEEFRKELARFGDVSDDEIFRDGRAYFRPMSWEEVIRLSGDSTVTIGSHGRTHYPLDILDRETLKSEMLGSKELIEQKIQKRVDYVSYPHGFISDDVLDATKESGYTAGITTVHGFNCKSSDPYLLKRNEVGNRGDINIFSSVISGSWDFFKGFFGQ